MVAVSCTCSYKVGKEVVWCKGPVLLQNIDLDEFDRIVVNGAADLKYAQDPEIWGVQVEANEEVFDYLNFRVEDRTLILEMVDSVQVMAEDFDIYTGSAVLKSVTINGTADVIIVAVDQKDNLDITVNGTGDMELQKIRVPVLSCNVNGAADIEATGLDAGHIDLSLNGAGDVSLSGKAESANFTVSGAGSIDARGLECDKIEKQKNGLARIRTK